MLWEVTKICLSSPSTHSSAFDSQPDEFAIIPSCYAHSVLATLLSGLSGFVANYCSSTFAAFNLETPFAYYGVMDANVYKFINNN